MNIDLRFQDWQLTLADACVRQYDDRAQTVRVTGCIPEGWHWKLYASVYSESYFNSIPLAESDGALSAVLTRDDLAFGDTIYTLQLVGEREGVTRHTNPVRLYVGASLSGDGIWPEVPRGISDAVSAAEAAAARAEAAEGTAMERLDCLAVFREVESGVTPRFTNVIPGSVDSDGTPYQSGAGYIDGYRMKSATGALEASDDSGVTGFIPLPEDPEHMILRFSGMRLKASGTSTASSIQFFDSAFRRTHGGQTGQGLLVIAETDSDGNIARIDFADQTAESFLLRPADAYFRISAYGLGADSIITINEAIAYASVRDLEAELVPRVAIPQLSPLEARLTALEAASEAGEQGVLSDCAEQLDKALTIGYQPVLTATNPNAWMSAKQPLNFLHISDTHGSVNLGRAVTVLNKLAADGRCACMVHTGDLHASTFASDYTAVQAALDAAEAPVLLVSGNHDVGNNQQTTNDTATDAELYDRVFAPVIDAWNVTSHPAGKCYWYKDFADSGVRLIGLHDFESDYDVDSETGLLLYKRGYAAYHQAQIDWLLQALLTCPADWGVIIAKHNPVNARGTLDNPFNSPYMAGRNSAQSYVSTNLIADIVQAFMDGEAIDRTYAQTKGVVTTLTVQADFSRKNAGAEFICYLDGHTHADGVSFLRDYPRQLELNIGADNFHYQHYSDTLNQQGTQHQDLINYVSVNRSFGYVYLLRIGNAFSARASRRDYTAIDYRNPPASETAPAPPEDPVLEPILTFTCDGTTRYNITEDENGAPLALKKAVIRITMGADAAAAGDFTLNAYSGEKLIGALYRPWSASAKASWSSIGIIRQESGFWTQEQSNFSNNGYGQIYARVPYMYVNADADYPVIDRLSCSAAPPAGMQIEIRGVRA